MSGAADGDRAEGLELFQGCPPELVREMLAGLPRLELEPEGLFDISRTDASCCLLLAGRLALEFAGVTDHPRVASLVEEGDLLVRPVQAWASVGPRLRCRAINPSTLVLVDHERLAAWITVPQLAANVVQVMSAQIADRELALAVSLEPSVERRLLRKLRQLALRWGRVTPEGVRLDLRLTHQELANMVGAVRESVTLAMGRLQDQGEIRVRNRTVVIRGGLDGDQPNG